MSNSIPRIRTLINKGTYIWHVATVCYGNWRYFAGIINTCLFSFYFVSLNFDTSLLVKFRSVRTTVSSDRKTQTDRLFITIFSARQGRSMYNTECMYEVYTIIPCANNIHRILLYSLSDVFCKFYFNIAILSCCRCTSRSVLQVIVIILHSISVHIAIDPYTKLMIDESVYIIAARCYYIF